MREGNKHKVVMDYFINEQYEECLKLFFDENPYANEIHFINHQLLKLRIKARQIEKRIEEDAYFLTGTDYDPYKDLVNIEMNIEALELRKESITSEKVWYKDLTNNQIAAVICYKVESGDLPEWDTLAGAKRENMANYVKENIKGISTSDIVNKIFNFQNRSLRKDNIKPKDHEPILTALKNCPIAYKLAKSELI